MRLTCVREGGSSPPSRTHVGLDHGGSVKIMSPQQDVDIAARTRAARRRLIQRIISTTRIHSQRELQQMLVTHGFTVTQATLSRDLKAMRASKARTASGKQVYVLPEAGAPGQKRLPDDAEVQADQHLAHLAEELLVSVACAHGDVVLQTPPGAAQLMAAAVDDAMLPGVLGTIAGDNTILIATTGDATGLAIAQHIASLSDRTPESPGPH